MCKFEKGLNRGEVLAVYKYLPVKLTSGGLGKESSMGRSSMGKNDERRNLRKMANASGRRVEKS